MSLMKLVSSYAHYNEWANLRAIKMLKAQDEGLTYEKTKSSFVTINHTLQHISAVERFWMRFISGGDIKNYKWQMRDGGVHETFEELEQSSSVIKESYPKYTEEELSEELTLDAPWSKGSQSRYEFMFHLVNHGTYHRGQVISQLRELGVTDKLINTDYAFFTLGKHQSI